MAILIDMQKVTKNYRGVPAVREVDFALDKGEIHALLGENGAGKSTLTKIMAGVIEATSGQMLYRGKEVVKRNVPAAQAVDELIGLIREDGNWVETVR